MPGACASVSSLHHPPPALPSTRPSASPIFPQPAAHHPSPPVQSFLHQLSLFHPSIITFTHRLSILPSSLHPACLLSIRPSSIISLPSIDWPSSLHPAMPRVPLLHPSVVHLPTTCCPSSIHPSIHPSSICIHRPFSLHPFIHPSSHPRPPSLPPPSVPECELTFLTQTFPHLLLLYPHGDRLPPDHSHSHWGATDPAPLAAITSPTPTPTQSVRPVPR